jgi:hypothetical protein
VTTELALGVVVLGLLIYRQLVARRVSSSSLRIMAILGVIGVVELVGWVLALGAHIGYDALLDHHHGTAGLGEATLVLYLAVSLGAQRLIVMQRARGPLPPGSPHRFLGIGAGPAPGR